jgi:REP element-mobilizing transposase RayT
LDIVPMPRGPRLDAPGVVHHVRARGIERRKLFRDDVDLEDFLERLALVTEGERAFVYAWALIPNHFHLAIRTGTMNSGVRLSEINGVSRPAVSQSISKGGKAFRELGWLSSRFLNKLTKLTTSPTFHYPF